MSCCRRNRRCQCQNYNWNNSNQNCGCNRINNYNTSNRNYNCNSMNNYNTFNRCSYMDDNCNSRNEQGFPENYMLAHAYTPNQVMNKTFTPEMALRNGTLFPELVSPYYPGQSMEIIEYLKTDNRNGGCGCE